MLQQGNAEAFDRLFEQYKNQAVRTAYLITGNRSVCEDVAQEAFLLCFRRIKSLRDPKAFTVWFYRILTRVAWRYGKLAQREIPSENIMEQADARSLGISLAQNGQREQN